MRTVIRCSWAICLLAATAGAQAVTLNDLQIMGRALSFLEKPLTGEVRTAIVIETGNPQSEREGQEMARLLGDGLRVGNVTLKPVVVKIADAARAEVGLFLLTAGLEARAAPVTAAAAQRRVVCVTTDIGQVRRGRCMMGVRSQPKIEILINRAEAARARLSFSAVFRMMITEI